MCPTIQAQVDNETDFNELFITEGFATYVSAVGDFFNASAPVWASVNLTCYYDDGK